MNKNLSGTDCFQTDLCPDCRFPSSNDFGVPDLDITMQAEYVDIPFVCFGEQRRTFKMGGCGTLHFYTDDYRFSAIYEHPERVLQHNPRNIVEPNFSLFQDMEVAFGLQAIYKKRWIARMMQSKGIRVFVDLNVASKWYRLNMLGVPTGWSSFCTRGYSDRLDYLEFEWNLAKRWAGNNPLTFAIYNGGDACRKFAQQHGCIYIDPAIKLKNKQKALDKIADTVLFLDEPELSLERLIPQARQAIIDNQIEDCRQEVLKFIKN